MRNRFKHILIPLVIGLASALVSYFLGTLSVFENLELMTVDKRFNSRGVRDPGVNVAIAAINDESQQALNTVWPFPRDWQAQFLANLHKAGARMAGFDVFFETSDKKNPGSDAVFASQINRVSSPSKKRGPMNIVLGGMLREINDSGGSGIQIVTPVQTLYETQKRFGLVTQPLDTDEKVRGASLFIDVPEFETHLPSFTLQAAALFLGLDGDDMTAKYFEGVKKTGSAPGSISFNNKTVPVQPFGRNVVFPINYYGPPRTFPTYSFHDFLLMDINPNIVLSTDGDGDGRADNAQNFHTLVDARDQLLPPVAEGNFASKNSIPLGGDFSMDENAFFIGEYDMSAKSGRVAVLRPRPDSSVFGGLKAVPAGELPLGPDVFPVRVKIVDRGLALLVLNGFDGSLIKFNLETGKRSATAPLPANARARFKSARAYLASGNLNSLYSDFVNSSGLISNTTMHEYIVNLPGLNDLVFYNRATLTASLFSDSAEMDFVPRIVRQSGDGENLFTLTSDNRLIKISLLDMAMSDFPPLPQSDSRERPTRIAALEYAYFKHAPSEAMKKDTLVKEKLYALDLGMDRILVYDANTLELIGKIRMPDEKLLDDIASARLEIPDLPEDTRIITMSMSYSHKTGKIYVACAGYSRSSHLENGAAHAYPGPFLLMPLDPFTDIWMSDSVPLELRPYESAFQTAEGRLMPLGQNTDGALKLMLLDAQTPVDNYRDTKIGLVKNRIVLVGPTAEALHDLFPTPFFRGTRTPGVEIHANAIQNMIEGNFLRVVRAGSGAGIALIVFFALASSFLTYFILSRVSIPVAILSFLALIAGWIYLSWMLFITFSVQTIVTLSVIIIATGLYAKLVPRFTKIPPGPVVGAITAVMRHVVNPAALAVFVLHSLSFVPATKLGALLLKSKTLAFASGNWILWLCLLVYLSATEFAPLLAFRLGTDHRGFGPETGAGRGLLPYRKCDRWNRGAAAVSTALIFAGAAAGIILSQNSAGLMFATHGFDVFAPIIKDMLAPVVTPCASVALSFIATTLFVAMTEGREKREIKDMFSKYVNADVVDIMINSPGSIRLGGQKLDVTVLFSDIRDFTSISESFPAEQVVAFLNEYLSDMTGIVLETKGTLDKFIGDCVMAFWGAPMPQKDHQLRAVRAALRMLKALDEINARWAAEGKGYPPIRIGIGINTAKVVVGNIGSDLRMDYTVIGDGVNLASRLEGQCKTYGVPLIVSEATHEAVKDLVWSRKLDDIAVKGKKEPVTIYEIIDFRDDSMLRG